MATKAKPADETVQPETKSRTPRAEKTEKDEHVELTERERSGGAFTSPPPGLETSFPHPDSFKQDVESGEADLSGGAFTQVEEGQYPVYEDTIPTDAPVEQHGV